MKAEKIIHFNIRKKVIASITQEGWKNIPHVSYVYEADATKFHEEFRQLKNISFNTLLLRVIIEGIKAAPQMNAEIRYNTFLLSGRITLKEEININMPVLLPNGEMVTVNLRDIGSKPLAAMEKQIADIMEQVRTSDMERSLLRVGLKDSLRNLGKGKVRKVIGRGLGAVLDSDNSWMKIKSSKRDDNGKSLDRDKYQAILSREVLDQGTITVSNLGAAIKGTQGRIGLLDIVPPQVCAIGIGVLQEKPGVYPVKDKKSAIGIRKMIPFTIAFDHRALDFGEVAPFINRLEEIFQNPKIMHTW